MDIKWLNIQAPKAGQKRFKELYRREMTFEILGALKTYPFSKAKMPTLQGSLIIFTPTWTLSRVLLLNN